MSMSIIIYLQKKHGDLAIPMPILIQMAPSEVSDFNMTKTMKPRPKPEDMRPSAIRSRWVTRLGIGWVI